MAVFDVVPSLCHALHCAVQPRKRGLVAAASAVAVHAMGRSHPVSAPGLGKVTWQLGFLSTMPLSPCGERSGESGEKQMSVRSGGAKAMAGSWAGARREFCVDTGSTGSGSKSQAGQSDVSHYSQEDTATKAGKKERFRRPEFKAERTLLISYVEARKSFLCYEPQFPCLFKEDIGIFASQS